MKLLSSKILQLFLLSALAGTAAQSQAQEPVPAASPSSLLAAAIERGKPVYLQTCFICHQLTGLGLPGAFPPLAQTEYTTGSYRRMIAIMIKGVQGPLKVKDVTYSSVMIAVDTQFPVLKDDNKLADVANYVRNSFGNKDDVLITPEMVGAVRQEFLTRTLPWTEPELLSFPEPAK